MDDRKVFADSVTPLPDQLGLTSQGLMLSAIEPQNRNEKMTLLFAQSIAPDAHSELEARVARGEVIGFDELKQKYSANPDDVNKLVAWLKAQGFDVVKQTLDGTGVYAQATVAQIEQSLGVKMLRVTKDGLTYTAAQNAPSLPAEVAGSVHAIIGLQPFRQAHKHNRKRVPKGGNRASLSPKSAAGAPSSTTVAPSPNIANAPPYLVPEILKGYGADGLSVSGRGQKIAVLIDTFPNDTDLTAFWQRNSLAINLNQIEKINVTGKQLPAPEGEETLDTEWASGIAPGATIRIYATATLQFVDLDMALDAILADLPTQPGLRQLSISLGLGETFMGGPNGEVATQHQKFLRLAASGVNVFVSSGDAGSNPDATGHSSTGPTQVEYESSDPFVIGVGGTSLVLSAGGGVSQESGWSSGGGGKSIFFARQQWQTGDGVPAGTERLVPDVSVSADPDEGAFLVLNGQPIQIGGTSWGAPVWAGFCALINEARTVAGKAPLGFLNPQIYPLMSTACFRDITTGSNGAFQAGPGYDMVTGIGVPNVRQLIQSLT
ncbi:MAG TPA: S53 family peptidase [Candidatus Acidoferrales bacterium]|nr:S53 family peptidase [Candidatus Acidoferrales bacterium]